MRIRNSQTNSISNPNLTNPSTNQTPTNQVPTTNPSTTPFATLTISNLVNNSQVISGVIFGTSTNATRVEVSLDGGAFVSATGTNTWRFQLPIGSATWRQFSKHSVQARAINSDNVSTTTTTINIVKSRNKDLDGDGYGDSIFTAPDTGAGDVHIFYGSPTGIIATTVAGANYTLLGEVNGNCFGAGALACDVNGDGFGDIIVSATKHNSDTGKVYIFHGGATRPSGTIAATTAITQIVGETANDQFGSYYLDCGDVNGDGFDDLATVSNNFTLTQANRGRAYIFHSSGASGITATNAFNPSTRITGNASAGRKFAYNLVLGDFQKDGFLDLAVSNINVNTDTGYVRIFHSTSSFGIATGGIETAANITLLGESTSGQFGCFMWAGDYNNDGYTDLVTGAHNLSSWTGKSYLFLSSGTSSGITITNATSANTNYTGESNNDWLGSAVALVDLNNDGFAEFISSATRYSNSGETGRVYIQPGAATAPTSGNVDVQVSRRLTGSATIGRFGAAIGFNDINGDGYMDFLTSANVIAPSGGVVNDGMAYIFLNNKTNSYFTGNFATDANTRITGQLLAGKRFGYNIGY